MLKGFFRRRPSSIDLAAEALYRRIVARARNVAFYRDLGVPDTVDGRFELVVLHAWLTIRRLGRLDESGKDLAQSVFDALFRDMDTNLREMGVGDIGVARRIKTMAQAYYGRAKAYEEAIESAPPATAGAPEAALDSAIERNLYGTVQPSESQVRQLALYVRQTIGALDETPSEALLRGEVEFPDVQSAEGNGAESS